MSSDDIMAYRVAFFATKMCFPAKRLRACARRQFGGKDGAAATVWLKTSPILEMSNRRSPQITFSLGFSPGLSSGQSAHRVVTFRQGDSTCHSLCPFARPSVCPSVCPSASLPVRLSARPTDRPSARPPVLQLVRFPSL